MDIKELRKALVGINPKAEIVTGNYTGCWDNGYLKDEKVLNIYPPKGILDSNKDLKKIREVIFWGDE